MASSRAVTSARFLLRSLSLRGPSFLLALLAVTVGATVATTMLNLKLDLRSKMSRELRRYGPNLLLVPAPEGPAGGIASTLDEAEARALPSRLGAPEALVSPLLLASAGVAATDAGGAPAARPVAAATVGADFDLLRRLNPSWRVEGRWPAPGEAACLAGASLASRAGLSPGGRALARAGGQERILAVAGIVATGEAEDEQLIVPLRVLQEMSGLPGRVSLVALSIDGGPEAVARAAAAAQAALPGAAARPLGQIAAAQGALLARLDRMMAVLTIAVLLLSGLCLLTTLMSMVVEREGEIGLMRSMGAGDGAILAMFAGEVSLLGLLGALLGWGLGALSAGLIGAKLFGAAIAARAEVAPGIALGCVVLCFMAVLLPLRRALAIQPAAVLRGE